MPMEAALIFPHQLFDPHPALLPGRPAILVEEWLFFRQYPFHKKKLILHRASMRAFEAGLSAQGIQTEYIPATLPQSDIRKLVPMIRGRGVTRLIVADPADNWVWKRLSAACTDQGIELILVPSPNFITNLEDTRLFFQKKRRYFQTDFYSWQRKSRQILISPDGSPEGGKWSYDDENRERYTGQVPIPTLPAMEANSHIREAIEYVEREFPQNPGSSASFSYPMTHEAAKAWFSHFLEHRFRHFGPYEDAMVPSENILFHSVLTPMLNIGLLDPSLVVQGVLEYGHQHRIPINSVEGFIRQVLGWREFIRSVYILEGSRQRTSNHFGFSRKIPPGFWTGETGILPVDTVIRQVLQDGYTHHINRLMVLGNFMLLCEFDPDEVYRWFMEMFVDAYDWVMVPNVYGMTQFADGGLMTTKPYISGSNYLMKMGSWPKGPWQQTWDALFWRFIHIHRTTILKNHRMGMLVRSFDGFSTEKRNALLHLAGQYLDTLK